MTRIGEQYVLTDSVLRSYLARTGLDRKPWLRVLYFPAIVMFIGGACIPLFSVIDRTFQLSYIEGLLSMGSMLLSAIVGTLTLRNDWPGSDRKLQKLLAEIRGHEELIGLIMRAQELLDRVMEGAYTLTSMDMQAVSHRTVRYAGDPEWGIKLLAVIRAEEAELVAIGKRQVELLRPILLKHRGTLQDVDPLMQMTGLARTSRNEHIMNAVIANEEPEGFGDSA